MRRDASVVVVAVGAAMVPAVASAHDGAAAGGVSTSLAAELPGAAALLGMLGIPYAAGVHRLWARAGRGRGIGVWEAVSYASGLLILAVALVGPALIAATDEFSGHMAQHLLLLVVVPPLLAFGRPGIAYAWWARRLGAFGAVRLSHRATGSPVIRQLLSAPALLAIYVAVVWGWHFPPLYEAAARHELLHLAEHSTMLAAAFAFWWRVQSLELGAARRQVMAFFMLLGAMFPELVLGAFITFAREPLYESHQMATEAAGRDPVTDQQLGGLAMLMMGGFTYAGVALAGMLRFLNDSALPEREERA